MSVGLYAADPSATWKHCRVRQLNIRKDDYNESYLRIIVELLRHVEACCEPLFTWLETEEPLDSDKLHELVDVNALLGTLFCE